MSKKYLALETFLTAWSLSLAIASAQVSIIGVFQDQFAVDNFATAATNANLINNSFSIHWNSSHGLYSVMSQIERLRSHLIQGNTRVNIVYGDINGLQYKMTKELLAVEDEVSLNSDKATWYETGFGSTHWIPYPRQMATDMVSSLESLKLPFKDVTVITDKTDIGQAAMTHLVQKIYKGGRYNVRIANAEKLIAQYSGIPATFMDSELNLIVCDGLQASKLFKMTRSIGQTGFTQSTKWILSGRAISSLPKGCFFASGDYYGVQTYKVTQNGSYIVKKAMECSHRETAEELSCTQRVQVGRQCKYPKCENGDTAIRCEDIVKEKEDLLSIVVQKQGKSRNMPRLRVSVNEMEPFVMVSQYTENKEDIFPCQIQGILGIKRSVNGSDILVCIHGFTIDILKELETTLGFVGIPMLTKDGKFGRYVEATGEIDGYIADIVHNDTDLGIDLFAGKSRSRVISFTSPYYIASLGIAYMQNSVYEEAAVLKPFSAMLWISIAGTIALLFAIMWMLERLSPYSQRQINKRSVVEEETFNFAHSAIYIWGTFFTGEIVSKKPKSTGSRCIAIVVSYVAILVLSAYSANLISFLVVLDESPLVTDLLDEKLVKSSSKLRIGLQGSAFGDIYLSTHYDQRVRSMSKSRVVKYKEMRDLYSALRERYVELIMSDFIALAYAEVQDKSCKLKAIPMKNKIGMALAYNNKSSWGKLLDIGAIELARSGKADMIAKKWFLSAKCTSGNTFSALDVTRMKTLFMWLSIGIAGCLIILIVAILIAKCKKLCKTEKEQEEF